MHGNSFDSIDVFFPATEILLLGGYKSKTIHSLLYEPVNARDVAKQLRIYLILCMYYHVTRSLFSGQLGCFPHCKVNLELKADAIPSQSHPYTVPQNHRAVFKEELNRLCEIGVSSRFGAFMWLSPSFRIPKKDSRVQWISDFLKLNEHIRRNVYHLPKISNILKRRDGYKYFTKLDISMQYYTFKLDDASKELCRICTPFGNYQYNRLPMGIFQAPDISQEIMEDLFCTLAQLTSLAKG
jgi:hypothetical protein